MGKKISLCDQILISWSVSDWSKLQRVIGYRTFLNEQLYLHWHLTNAKSSCTRKGIPF